MRKFAAACLAVSMSGRLLFAAYKLGVSLGVASKSLPENDMTAKTVPLSFGAVQAGGGDRAGLDGGCGRLAGRDGRRG